MYSENKTLQSKGLLKLSITAQLIFIMAATSIAQGGPGDPGDENPDNGVPLGGGVALLLVMAAMFVIFKAWQLKQKNKLSSLPVLKNPDI